ncbi:MAG: tRNA threonylcarbamoyladenosine dehydratase [Lachnospiraceae bacterium]
MDEKFVRTGLLIGEEGLDKLEHAKVAVFGIGGVGGYVVEALARTGVGTLELIDQDVVSVSNINRQIIATTKTVGRSKTEVMKERILDINPKIKVITHECFFLPENAAEFQFEEYDYIIDAVDTVTAKIELVVRAKEVGRPIISSMGAGNKLDAGKLEITDIYQTLVCPLARVMRRELKKRNIKNLKVVYSKEEPLTPKQELSDEFKRVIPGSVAFVPAVAGLLIAGEVIKDLIMEGKGE